jgi:hypothetical protein
MVPESFGATYGTIENDLNDLIWLFADNLAGVFDFLMIKEYFQFLNRLYDITWFGAVYA